MWHGKARFGELVFLWRKIIQTCVWGSKNGHKPTKG
nr:MAG TPA: hypothetical protein [Caudoviricetes sp.]